MSLEELIRTLWRRRFALAVVILIALAAAVLAGYRPMTSPLRLESRALPLGVASKQVVVDAPTTVLANLKQDIRPMTDRTGTFAQVLATNEIRMRTARAIGVPAAKITTEGPFTGAAAAQNVVTPSEARSNQVVAETIPYRLNFVAQLNLPIVTINAQAPSPEAAARLADGAGVALEAYLKGLRTKLRPDTFRPIIVRDLGPATAGAVHGGIGKAVTVLAFVGVLILGLLFLLSVEVLRTRLAPVEPKPLPGAWRERGELT